MLGAACAEAHLPRLKCEQRPRLSELETRLEERNLAAKQGGRDSRMRQPWVPRKQAVRARSRCRRAAPTRDSSGCGRSHEGECSLVNSSAALKIQIRFCALCGSRGPVNYRAGADGQHLFVRSLPGTWVLGRSEWFRARCLLKPTLLVK